MIRAIKDIKRRLNPLWLYAAIVAVMLAYPLAMTGSAVDSLYNLYMNAEPESKAEIANKVFYQLKLEQFNDVDVHFDKSANANLIDAKTHQAVAEYYFIQEQFEASMQASERARKLVDLIDDERLKSEILAMLANGHYRLSNYDKSLEAILAALKIDKELGDKELISSDFNTLAVIYLAVERPDQGIVYIDKAIAMERKMKNNGHLSTRLGTACELYLMDGQIDKAMQLIKEAYDIDKKDGREEKAAIRLSQMGAVYEALSMFDNAKVSVTQALKVLESSSNIYSTAVCHNQLGSLAAKAGHPDEAIAHYKKALELSIKCGAPKVELTAERGLWQTMREDNPAVAMLHLERYTVLNDSLHAHIDAMQTNVMSTTATNKEQTALIKDAKHDRLLLTLGGCLLALMTLVTIGGLLYVWRRNKRALQLLRQASGMRSRFIDNITHELQTPLTVIINAGEQLRKGVKSTGEENRHLGEIIQNHGNNMLGLVNQLLDIEKTREPLSSNKPITRQGDIIMFVRLLVENYTERAQQEHIQLEFTSPLNTLNVSFVPENIRKITHLLIDNAFKFTPQGGSITVAVDAPDKGWMRLRVSDTGKGIPVQEQNRIFEPFYQGNPNHEAVDTVIDLALVNQLVQSMNGNISLDSEPGRGTTFTINLPAQPYEPETSQQFVENRILTGNASKHKPLVFIVENNDDIAFLIGSHLRNDYELRFANDGLEALSNARNLSPDLIITNIAMPVMDGKELIKRLHEDDALNHIPIIAMTSDPSEQERISCIEAGADAVLVKPFNSAELVLLTSHMVRWHNLLRERFTKTMSMPMSDAQAKLSKEDKAFINRLVDVIRAQMTKGDIELDNIAAAMSISRKQLRTRVMAITGLTPVAYVQQVRLNRARLMMAKGDMSLTTIAKKCGFPDPSYFSKVFKQQFGVSPTQFRKNADDIPHQIQ